MEVYTRLDGITKITDEELIAISVQNDLKDIVEIFSGLNSRGTRVREADIYLGIVAARKPGWVRDNFLLYIEQLADAGYDVGPTTVFASLTAIGAGRVKYKSVPDEFWDSTQVERAWSNLKHSCAYTVRAMSEFGITSNSLFPTENALVILLLIVGKFTPKNFAPVLHWFLQASRYGRYSGATTTSLDEDIREIIDSEDIGEALSRLNSRIRQVEPLSTEDFMRDYSDGRFGRLILYLMTYSSGALDWDVAANRIGFDGPEILQTYQPQFYHIFPKGFLRSATEDSAVNALANIAVIGPKINRRISSKNPMD
ncbi:MAG: hypothetical protein ACJ8H8_02865 [Geminicoccaceae bacterium]